MYWASANIERHGDVLSSGVPSSLTSEPCHATLIELQTRVLTCTNLVENVS